MFDIINETDFNINDLDYLYNFVGFVVDKEGLDDALFNIIFVTKEKIQELNKNYRNVDSVTDVISFALEDEKDNYECGFRILGDIYICIDRAIEQAESFNHSLKRELSFLTIHGILHLLGYDHMNEEDEKIMFGKQEAYLQEFGIFRQ